MCASAQGCMYCFVFVYVRGNAVRLTQDSGFVWVNINSICVGLRVQCVSLCRRVYAAGVLFPRTLLPAWGEALSGCHFDESSKQKKKLPARQTAARLRWPEGRWFNYWELQNGSKSDEPTRIFKIHQQSTGAHLKKLYIHASEERYDKHPAWRK